MGISDSAKSLSGWLADLTPKQSFCPEIALLSSLLLLSSPGRQALLSPSELLGGDDLKQDGRKEGGAKVLEHPGSGGEADLVA